MQESFSHSDRAKQIDKFKTSVFDLAIIGGGITGAGAARDAASRGMSVALIEAQDFAQGTSSRSSKLIHGGIRYLENLEFGLVFEALSERRLLFEIAPHLVHPLRFVLPLYKGGRVGMFKMGLGMWLYDALSTFEAPEMHERLSAHEAIERLPLLQDNGLLGAFAYSDAYMDDDRLVIETLRSAARHGASCANYVSAEGAKLQEGKVTSITCRDRVKNETFEIRARHFVSTVGPWTDIVGQKMLPEWKRILRPSKGIHLTFDRSRLPLKQAVVMAADAEKRIVFGIPRHEMIIVGTTDTDYKGDPGDVNTSSDDVKYLLRVAGEYFPGAKLTVDDIIATYAGVRPLVHDGSETESKTSREHVILRDPHNVTFVAGGKYTTYRLMGEQTVKAALRWFGTEDNIRFRHGQTKAALNPRATVESLSSSLRMVKTWAMETGLSEKTVRALVDRHAGEAHDLLHQTARKNYTGSEDAKLWSIEAWHAIHQTMCLHLTDFYVRRSPLFLARADHGLPLLEDLSRVFADELRWSDSQRSDEVAAVKAHIARELSWREGYT